MMAGNRWLFTVFTFLALGCGDKAPPPEAVPAGPAPDSFRVAFETTRGNFVVQVRRDWAPNGADRFYRLVGEHFFDDERFFRVLPNYIAQFGLNDDRKLDEKWRTQPIKDDSLRHGNTHGTLSFASEGLDSRTHQLFFNLKDNTSLDKQGFIPIGLVISGLSVVDSLYDGYGDAPSQTGILARGNNYLARFPKLDVIKSARIVK